MDHVEDIIQMLDSMAQAGVSRIKLEASDEIAEGTAKKSYHHGRCDVGSPFATGKLVVLADQSACNSSLHPEILNSSLLTPLFQCQSNQALRVIGHKKRDI